MEKDDYIEFVAMGIVYGWMLISGTIFKTQPQIGQATNALAYILMIVFLVVKEMYAKYAASAYLYAPSTIRPYNKKFDLFLEMDSKGNWETKPTAIPNLNVSVLPLGKAVKKLGEYLNVTKIGIIHEFNINDRLRPHKGKCNWAGNIVDHNQVSEITLYEENLEDVGSEFAEPIPYFRLIEAPGDYENEALQSDKQYLVPEVVSSDEEITAHIWQQNQVIKKLSGYAKKLETRLITKAKQSSHWHTEYSQLWAAARQIREELTGLQKNFPNFNTKLVARADAVTHTLDDIYQLADSDNWLNGLDWKWIALIVVGSIGIITIGLNEQMRTQIFTFFGENQAIAAIAIIGGLVATYYIVKQFLRRK